MANKLRIKNNVRGQFQIAMTTLEGTINCVVSVPLEPCAQATPRRDVALELAKALARRLDEEIDARAALSAR
jgi:predicted amidophosphoribosyltransferase